MKSIFRQIFTPLTIVAIVLFTSFSQTSCSRKSGCPAEDVQAKTGPSGIPKAGKAKSGLLPPNAHKKKKS